MMSKADLVKDDDSSNNLIISSQGSDYMIGFNDSRFSDRELIIEIFADDVGESSCAEVCSRSTKLHVNSLILAAKSPFFHNLLTNGMRESEQRCVTLKIHASEETAAMELLNYLYSGRLTAETAPALLDVLKLAGKFQVVSCMTLCASLLLKLPMSTELALRCLDVTLCSLPMADEFQILADAAKRYLEARYKDVVRVGNKEIMEMPLVGMEAILSSDALEVASEDELFELAVTWTKAHYPQPEDQRKILSTHLARHIRFPYMSLDKLREVFDSKILDDDFACKVAVDALFFRTNKTRHHHHQFARRAYRRRPVTVLEFQLPFRNLVAYFDLTFDECVKLKPSEYLYSETFDFCGHVFDLYATRFPESRSYFSFCLDARLLNNHHPVVDLECEFAAMSKTAQKFVSKASGLCYSAADDLRELILYETPWVDFESGRSLDFIHGILYIELKLTFRQ